MKVVNNDILYNKDVLYFAPNDLSVRQKILYNILFFMTRYGWENMVPEFIYRYLYPLQTIHGYEQVYFIIYEQNVCSTHLPFLEYLKKNIRIQNCSTCLQIHCLPESMRNSCGLWKIIGKSLT